jgi:RNA polymerase sporulation-specific sigma factor
MHLRSSKKYEHDLSIQDPIGKDKEGNSITWEDKLTDDSENLEDSVVLKTQVAHLYSLLASALTERERQIIEMRYGLSYSREITQREIGDELQISRSYVSRIEKRALEKLFKGMSFS